MKKWLAAALGYIPRWIAFQLRQQDLPGVAVAITADGKLALDCAFGIANRAAGAALTPGHNFRVASHSKTFTAVGLLKLADAGRLRLDDAVGHYVEGLNPQIAKASLAQLLSHSAGVVRDGRDGGQWVDRRPFLNEAELREALAEPPILEPNLRFKYSNHAFGLLGLVIAAVTGESYNDWVAREVVAAAGLTGTYPDANEGARATLSQGHSAKLLFGERLVIPGDNPTYALAAATGFISSAKNLAQFYSQLNPDADQSILSVASRREMTRRHWRVPDTSAERHYGLGLIHGDIGDWPWYGHSGSFQGFATHTAVLPSQELCVSVLTNASDGGAAQLFDGVTHILQAFAHHGAPHEDVAHWTGRWWTLWGATDLTPMGHKVLVALPAQLNPFADVSELTPCGADAATITKAGGFGNFGEPARLVRNDKGDVSEVWLAGDRLQSEQAFSDEARRRYPRE
ncbi:beta-lactamase [Methylocella silvestris BL2]|uniref:Beta-lactamase n=1 Tax=Methylocella silvestris (strain DSM 15510 / CIP 108128 / LMG 27833 / NCIMB 13906 / BL2) TaxID=395965 RepID=B8ELB3_METSB|nr:serine hydrolase domain-containing protein [Methylocella silvestris]ACK49108.1 beta-lactamase [Methylocella silvestris BL2]